MSVCLLSRISKSYRSDFLRRRKAVLEDISFQLEPGETFAYLGHNGAGKTTTIKAILGLIRVDEGRLSVFDRPAGDPAALARIGYLPENPYFYDHLRGREFLELVADLHGIARADSKRRIGEVLELVDMSGRAEEYLRGYSKGMLQRIGLAQALINDPDLLILDEPMGGLDPVGRHQIRAILGELKSRGKTLFLSSHILGDIEAVADRAAILSAGRLRRVVRVADLVADHHRKEVQCRGLSPDAASALSARGYPVRRRNELNLIEVEEDAQLPEVLEAVRQGGGLLLRVIPLQASLEDVFLAEIAGARPGDAASVDIGSAVESLVKSGAARENAPEEVRS